MTEYKGFTPSAGEWLRPGKLIEPMPAGFEELDVAMVGLRQEMPVSNAAQNKGWAWRIMDSLRPGKREINSARRALVTYWMSADVTMLDTAISHFRKAGVRRQRNFRKLALNFFINAMERYEGGHKQEDLERANRTGDDARNLWSDGTNPGMYGMILHRIAMNQQYLYDQSIVNRGSGGSDLGAFELAMKYFLEVIKNKHVGDLRLLSRLHLGLLIKMRCEHENTTSGLETCIEHWEYALAELNSPKADTGHASTATKEAMSADDKLMAESWVIWKAEFTYNLGTAYLLQYRIREDLDRDRRLHNLNKSIHYFERAKILFEEMENPAFSPSNVLYALATRLALRWGLTKEQSDLDRAKELLQTAQTVETVDEELEQMIARLLTAINDEIETH